MDRLDDALAAGEDIETVLSFALRAADNAHGCRAVGRSLAALLLPLTLRRLHIARDADAAGDMALAASTKTR